MQISFDKLSDTSRLWVYQAQRPFTKSELDKIIGLTESFITNWEAHGQPLAASYEIRYNQFLIISVDESYNGATGCSIDASVALVRNIEAEVGISMLDRSQIAFLDNDQVTMESLASLKTAVVEGKITKDIPVFNNSVSSLKDYKEKWIVPAGDSWMSRYFN